MDVIVSVIAKRAAAATGNPAVNARVTFRVPRRWL